MNLREYATVGSIGASGYDPYRVSFTSRDYLAQHPDVIAKSVRASIRGWQSYLRDPAATNTALIKLNPALNPAQETYTAQALRDGGFVTGTEATSDQTGRMTPARWQATYDQLKSLGILHSPIEDDFEFRWKPRRAASARRASSWFSEEASCMPPMAQGMVTTGDPVRLKGEV